MKKVEPASQQTMKAYKDICDQLQLAGAEVSSMFGMPALKRDSKAFAGLFGDAMVFKLTGDAHRDALALTGSELFDPSGMKRPMKAWVVVAGKHRTKWATLSRLSFDQLGVSPKGNTKGKAKVVAKSHRQKSP